MLTIQYMYTMPKIIVINYYYRLLSITHLLWKRYIEYIRYVSKNYFIISLHHTKKYFIFRILFGTFEFEINVTRELEVILF